MKKIIILTSFFIYLSQFDIKGQVNIGSISLISIETDSASFCFNNTKLMSGKNTEERYLVYFNDDSIYLNVLSSGNWSRNLVYSGNNILSASLAYINDTIWICWKEGNFKAQIKARYTTNKGNSWNQVINVSNKGIVSAPSIYASKNGKIHFVWSEKSSNDTVIYYNAYNNNTFLYSTIQLSNTNAQGYWPSIIAKGDTVLCTWKEGPFPTRVWFRSSFNGGKTWSTDPTLTTTLLSKSKDPNLAYAYDKTSNKHYTYLSFDSQDKIYIQVSNDFGDSWSSPQPISNIKKLSQFAHIECNNSGFVGISYEHRMVKSIKVDSSKDVGFVYSTNWAANGSFGNDSLAYSYDKFGSVYPAFNKIDENNFYLVWLTKDTKLNIMKVYERSVNISNFGSLFELFPNLKLKIFPNPANDIVNVRYSNQKIKNVRLYSFSGKLINEFYDNTFSVLNISNGLYILAIETEKEIIKSKISITHN